jgi:hypothetical protein
MFNRKMASSVALTAALIAAPVLGGAALVSSAHAATTITYFDGRADIGARQNSSVGATSGSQVYVLGWGDSQFMQRTEVYEANNTRNIYARSDGPTGAGFITAWVPNGHIGATKANSVARCYFFDPQGQYNTAMSSGMKCTVIR